MVSQGHARHHYHCIGWYMDEIRQLSSDIDNRLSLEWDEKGIKLKRNNLTASLDQ